MRRKYNENASQNLTFFLGLIIFYSIMNTDNSLLLILDEGESLKVEFKERLANLDREIVAMANTLGGSIFLGVDDSGQIIGIKNTNRLHSQIVDIARNCDPSIAIDIITHKHHEVIEIQVAVGNDKPYRCKDGFFLRIGPSSQKLKRDEIIMLINNSGKIHFDENHSTRFKYPEHFSSAALTDYLNLCQITTKLAEKEILLSLSAATQGNNQFQINNAGILFFAKSAQSFFPEAYITCVKYQSYDRFSILDKKDFTGTLIQQIEDTLAFMQRYNAMKISFEQPQPQALGARKEIYEYPLVALREALINAVTHRDYLYDASHIYVHIFPDRIEIENPGGLYHGLTLENLGQRSVRRNRLIADLLHRAGYIERVGSGFARMEQALKNNNNPPYQVNVTNFFQIRFFKRIESANQANLSDRQLQLLIFFREKNSATKREAAAFLNVSEDTALREIKSLIDLKLLVKKGTGKATYYTQSV